MESTHPELLAGKVAWVTASSRGLGRAIAERLAHCGASVAIHSRSDKTAAEFNEAPSTSHVADEIAKLGAPVTTVFADVSDLEQVNIAVEQIENNLGPIDILVNNAGGDIAAAGGKPKPNDAVGIPLQDIEAVLNRNLTTTLYCCRAGCARHERTQAGQNRQYRIHRRLHRKTRCRPHLRQRQSRPNPLHPLLGRTASRPQHHRQHGRPGRIAQRSFPDHRPSRSGTPGSHEPAHAGPLRLAGRNRQSRAVFCFTLSQLRQRPGPPRRRRRATLAGIKTIKNAKLKRGDILHS